MVSPAQVYSTTVVAREESDLGRKFLRFSTITLMCLSIVAPVMRFTADFWMKVDILLLPVVAVVYLWMLLTGLARPVRLNSLMIVAPVFATCIFISLVYGTKVLGHALWTSDLFDVVKPFLPVAFFTLAYEAELSESSLRVLLTALLFSAVLICIYAYGQWFDLGFTYALQPFYSGGLHDEGSLAHYRRVYSTISNPNFLGMLMTWLIAAFSLGALFRVGSRLCNLALLLGSIAVLAMTGSRYGFIDTAFALVLLFFLPAPTEKSAVRRKTTLLLAVPVLLGGVLLVATTNKATLDRFQMLETPEKERSLRLRLDGLWRDAGELFLQSPLFGHGPAKSIFGDVFTDSEYLMVLKEYGLLGIVPYFCYFLLPLAMVWKGLRGVKDFGEALEREWPATYWALCASFILIVTALVMNVGMSTYFNLSLMAFLWMWMGIGASCARRLESASLSGNFIS
jgi:O-antigen ligase